MAALIRQFRQTVCPLTRAVLFGSSRQASSAGGPPKVPSQVYEEFDSEVRTSIDAVYKEKSGISTRQEPEITERLGALTDEQRTEILETLRGNPDPFDSLIKKQDSSDMSMGRFETPIIVPSTSGERLVGCVCEEDSSEVVWMVLYSGEKKMCECGNWFQLHDIEGAKDH